MTERKPEQKAVAVPGGAAVHVYQQLQLHLATHAQEGKDHSHNDHDNGHGRASEQRHRDMKSDATLPQLVALGGVSFLALAIGLLAPAN